MLAPIHRDVGLSVHFEIRRKQNFLLLDKRLYRQVERIIMHRVKHQLFAFYANVPGVDLHGCAFRTVYLAHEDFFLHSRRIVGDDRQSHKCEFLEEILQLHCRAFDVKMRVLGNDNGMFRKFHK